MTYNKQELLYLSGKQYLTGLISILLLLIKARLINLLYNFPIICRGQGIATD